MIAGGAGRGLGTDVKPGAASIVARLILREGFRRCVIRLGGRRAPQGKAAGMRLLFPIVIGH